MSEVWFYYVAYVLQLEDKIGLSAKIVPLSHRLDSSEAVVALTDALTAEAFPDGIPVEFADKKMLPLTVLTWQLLTAKRSSPKDNGRKRPTH